MGGSSQRLVMGVFSISPAYGIIGPGMSQSINIECVAERSGKHEEVSLQYLNVHTCTTCCFILLVTVN